MRPLVCAVFALLLGSSARAQDLSFIANVFKTVHSVTLAAQGGQLVSSRELATNHTNCAAFEVCGMAAEVLFDLTAPSKLHLELGLGASYLRGFHEAEGSPVDLHGAVRSFPTISAYLTQDAGDAPIQPYVGVNFGISDLWNVQAYDSLGKEFTLKGQTFDYGGTAGFYTAFFRSFGLFAEISYKQRKFPSVDWSDGSIPAGAPREFNFNSLIFSAGVQVSLKDEEKGPPAYEGMWVLTRVDGSTLPALFEQESNPGGTGSIRNEIVSGVLTIERANYELLLRRRSMTYDNNGRLITATHPAVPAANITREAGNHTISPRNDVITFYPNKDMAQKYSATRNGTELMLYLREANHVLEFKKVGG
jgi:hypothetical protein